MDFAILRIGIGYLRLRTSCDRNLLLYSGIILPISVVTVMHFKNEILSGEETPGVSIAVCPCLDSRNQISLRIHNLETPSFSRTVYRIFSDTQISVMGIAKVHGCGLSRRDIDRFHRGVTDPVRVIHFNFLCIQRPNRQIGNRYASVGPGGKGRTGNRLVDLDRYAFVTADEYLSGNVRRKLRMVKALQEVLPPEKKELLTRNIDALTAVQPVDLTAGEIGVRIGVNWVPREIYEQFLYEVIGTSAYARDKIHVLYSPHSGEWNVTNKSFDGSNIKAVTTYGTKRINAYHIFEQTLNQKDVRIYDTKIDADGNEVRVLNKKETAIAQDRQELIKAKFAEWVWKDIDRRERPCGIYNETFNAIRPREYDGQHIRFSGMNPAITLRKHQINAIAHIMYGGNTLLAHEVGAGKTFEIVAAAMESKRLGLCTKSLIVVPNHITEQWSAEWLQLYPSANILVATKKDFETTNRKKFCARIATGDYDAIIIGHSQFEKIPMSKERQEIIPRRQIDSILDGIREAKRNHAENYSN